MSSGTHPLVNEMSDKTSMYCDTLELEETQKKTFGKWVQFQLSRHPSPKHKQAVTDLYYDLRDGHNLLDLLEVIIAPNHTNVKGVDVGDAHQATTIGPSFAGSTNSELWKRENGNLRVHHLANAGTVLNILRDIHHPFSKCVNINSVDIVDGKDIENI